MTLDCPYSTSKAVAELVFETYASLPSTVDRVPSVSVRFGNVIGGGDYGARRLVPDIMAALRTGQPVSLRRPEAVRPWQHVLDIVNGLLKAAAALLDARVASGEVFNFAPPGDGASVRELVAELLAAWGEAGRRPVPTRIEADPALHEQALLRLDGRKAASALGWRHLLDLRGSASAIVAWELAVLDGLQPIEAFERQVRDFLADPAVSGAGESTQSIESARSIGAGA